MDLRHLFVAAAAALAMVSVHAQSTAPAPLCDGWYCILGTGKPSDTPTTGTPASVEPGTGSESAASTPLDTESTILDYLKNDPNYANLFVKEPTTGAGSSNPCDAYSCIGNGTGAPTGAAPGTPVGVTDENALDFLKNNPAYAALLKDTAFTGGDALSGSTSGQPSSGPGLGLSDPNCVSYYTYVCDKDLPGAKDNKDDDDKKTPEERATVAANSVADFLTGDAKDACEAMLCLSSGDRPGECDPPIARYLSIKKRTAAKTAQARADFLAMCPISGDNGPKLKP